MTEQIKIENEKVIVKNEPYEWWGIFLGIILVQVCVSLSMTRWHMNWFVLGTMLPPIAGYALGVLIFKFVFKRSLFASFIIISFVYCFFYKSQIFYEAFVDLARSHKDADICSSCNALVAILVMWFPYFSLRAFYGKKKISNIRNYLKNNIYSVIAIFLMVCVLLGLGFRIAISLLLILGVYLTMRRIVKQFSKKVFWIVVIFLLITAGLICYLLLREGRGIKVNATSGNIKVNMQAGNINNSRVLTNENIKVEFPTNYYPLKFKIETSNLAVNTNGYQSVSSLGMFTVAVSPYNITDISQETQDKFLKEYTEIELKSFQSPEVISVKKIAGKGAYGQKCKIKILYPYEGQSMPFLQDEFDVIKGNKMYAVFVAYPPSNEEKIASEKKDFFDSFKIIEGDVSLDDLETMSYK